MDDTTRVTLEYTAPHPHAPYSRLGVTLGFDASKENFDKEVKQKGRTLLNIRKWMEAVILEQSNEPYNM